MRESDESLRDRLLYVAGDIHSERLVEEILHAKGQHLDDIAWRYGLRRQVVMN